MKFIKRHWGMLLLLAIVVIWLIFNIQIVINCDGTSVRGLFSMECIVESQSNPNK